MPCAEDSRQDITPLGSWSYRKVIDRDIMVIWNGVPNIQSPELVRLSNYVGINVD